MPKFISTSAKDLIKGILNTDPTKRFKINDIRQSQWFTLNDFVEQKGIIVG